MSTPQAITTDPGSQMGGIKEVKVNLTPADEKALSRTRRARRPRKSAEDTEQVGGSGLAAQVERVAEPAPIPYMQDSTPAPVPPPVPAAPIITVTPASAPTPSGVEAPKASLASTSVVGGGIKISAKRTTTSAPVSIVAPISANVATTGGVARIIPTKKRISAAPAAQTLKKPRLIVSQFLPPKNAPPPPQAPEVIPKRRRFTERRISISMHPTATTRKHRKHLKDRIAAMPIGAVRRLLIRKGLLKPKVTQPPEEIMRGMLKDYLLLHAAE